MSWCFKAINYGTELSNATSLLLILSDYIVLFFMKKFIELQRTLLTNQQIEIAFRFNCRMLVAYTMESVHYNDQLSNARMYACLTILTNSSHPNVGIFF